VQEVTGWTILRFIIKRTLIPGKIVQNFLFHPILCEKIVFSLHRQNKKGVHKESRCEAKKSRGNLQEYKKYLFLQSQNQGKQ